MSIEKSINTILATGTKIVSFDYHGSRRNVLIGAKEIESNGAWGSQLNRAIRENKGEKYLIARVQNDPVRVKAFRLTEIENPSAALANGM